MKTVFYYLFIAVFLVSNFAYLPYFFHYQNNKKFYAEVLCENKTNTKFSCKGRCVLAKKIKNLNQHQAGQTENKLLKIKNFNLFNEVNMPLNIETKNFVLYELNSGFYRLAKYLYTLQGLFRPPQY